MHEIDVIELVAAARGRVKVEIGLPPRLDDDDAAVVWIVGSKSALAEIKFDRIILTGETIVDTTQIAGVDIPTIQSAGIIDNQIAIKIEIPNLPSFDKKTEAMLGWAQRAILVAAWVNFRIFKLFIFNKIVLEVNKLRLIRVQRIVADIAFDPAKRLKAIAKEPKLNRSVTKRTFRSAKFITKFRKPAFVVGKLITTVALRALVLVGLAIDVIIIANRVVRGVNLAGIAGGIGALAGGIFDVFTLGFAAGASDRIEARVTRGVQQSTLLGQSR